MASDRGVTLPLPDKKSYLSATKGSTRVARLAGMRQATRATSNRLTDTRTNVVMSVAVTPNNKLDISRVKA